MPVEKAYTYDDILTDPQAWESGALIKAKHADGNESTFVTNPVRIGDADTLYAHPLLTRRVGADTHEVLSEVLGKSDAEIDALVDKGIAGV